MEKIKIYIIFFCVILLLHSCYSLHVAHMNSSKMNKLELNMSKEQVISILGNDYTISEKRLEDNNEVAVLSYRDHYNRDEFYLFVFKNKKLEKWYRELLTKESD